MNFNLPEDLIQWQHEVRTFVRDRLQPLDDEVEATGIVPPAALSAIARKGLFGTNTPRAYGGLGHSMLGSCLAIEELAKAHGAFYYLCGVNVHIGSKAIELAGSEAQKARWLPELASGRVIGAYALTEPGAGSDAAGITTSARLEGDRYVLNGMKTYITNAAEAGVFTLFATIDPTRGPGGICAFLIEAGTPGLEIGRRIEMVGGRGASHCELVLRDCHIPVDNMIGAQGSGFATAMRCLDAGRVHWGAYSVGVAQQLLDMAIQHVSKRRQFERPLRDNQGLAWRIAEMSASLHAARLVAYEAAWRYDHDPDSRVRHGALSKFMGGDMAFSIADQTMQLFGGSGYSKDLPIERIWREARVVRILDGTSEIMRQIIAREIFRESDRRNRPTG